MVTTARSKVKSRLHYDVTHLQPLTNVHTKNQLPTLYGFRDIARTKFFKGKVLWQDPKPNQGHTMTLHSYNPEPINLQSASYILRFPRYSPDKILKVKVTTARSKVK